MMANFKIDDGAYGDATDAIRRVIGGAERHRWFPAVTMDEGTTAAVRGRLVRHFEILGEAATARSLVVDFIQGGWDMLAETYRTVNPAGDDPAYASGAWREMLGAISGGMRRELERSRRNAIVPPLFPVVGNAGIVGGMLTTEISGANVLTDETHRQTVWYLMCDVDADFWSAIIWPIAYEARRDENPFRELAETYILGFYPLGFVGERFVVYSYGCSRGHPTSSGLP
jgi:hypothetical protein